MKGEISSRKRFVFVLAAAFAVATVTYGWLKAQDAPTFAPGSMRARGGEDLNNVYVQVNLVASTGYVYAKITDPNLINPWGTSASATSPIWISNQGTDTATLYTVNNILTVIYLVCDCPPLLVVPRDKCLMVQYGF